MRIEPLTRVPLFLLVFGLSLCISPANSAEDTIPELLLVEASAGDMLSQYELGLALDDGELFGPKVRESFRWFKLAADQGMAVAEHQVGLMYLQGRGTAKNLLSAMRYLEQAALKASQKAQLELGGLMLIENNYERAYVWFALAAALADSEEDYNLAVEGRDEAVTHISEITLYELQSFATTCLENNFENCDLETDLGFVDIPRPADSTQIIEPQSELSDPSDNLLQALIGDDLAANIELGDKSDHSNVLVAETSQGERVNFSYSSLDTGGDSLENQIVFPDTDGDIDLSIKCLAGISIGGEYDSNWCFPVDLDQDRDFIRSIHRATQSARNMPARREATAVKVYFTYRVTFKKVGGTKEIKVYPNGGLETGRYGESYYAPQAILHTRTFSSLKSRCFSRSNRSDLLTISARISADGGLAMETNIDNVFRCQSAWLDFFDRREYIPAFSDGRYVEALYVEQYWKIEDVRRSVVYPRDDSPSPSLDWDFLTKSSVKRLF